MPRTVPTPIAALLATFAAVTLGCAQAADPGTTLDNCRLRDCGPLLGGDGGHFDGNFGFDSPVGPPADGAPKGDATKDSAPSDAPTPTDTAPPADTLAPVDTDPVGVDSGPPPDTTPPPPVDSGPTCPVPTGKACGWSPQCGCSAGQNCDFTKVDGTVSCVAAGSVGPNGTCKALGDCAAGLSCVAGLCLPFCSGDPDCAGGGAAICHTVSGGGSPPKDVPGMLVCMQQCDPHAPTAACGAGLGCSIVDGVKGETTCTGAGISKSYSGCATDSFACAPGYACIGAAGDCLAWCRVGVSGDCSGGRICYSFTDHPKLGAVEYGVCDF